MSYISQKHISKGRGPAPAVWMAEDDYCLSLLFPALLVSCLELVPHGSNSFFLTTQTIFHTKPRLFVPRPPNYLGTLTKICWLRKLCWSEVKKQLPLAVCPLTSKQQTLVSQPLQLPWKWEPESSGEGMLEFMSMFPFEDRSHYVGCGAGSWRKGTSSPARFHHLDCKAAPRPGRLSTFPLTLGHLF